MPLLREELSHFLNKYLTPEKFQDYGPNGLQIEGTKEIGKVCFAVSATIDSITKAQNSGADALICHHGLFWKFHGVRTLTGPFGKRVSSLIKANINLYGYHLPLDAHPISGNAVTLAQELELTDLHPFGDYKGSPTGTKGAFKSPIKISEFKKKCESLLNHPVLLSSPDESAMINTLGIITGGANGDWQLAAEQGLDAYLTGEMSEHDWHESKESGVHMLAAGHHATEKLGIQALMKVVSKRFPELETSYIDSANPA